MNARALLALSLVLALSAGCKKKAPPPAAGPAPQPVAAAPAAAETPAHVQELMGNFEKVFFDTDSSDLNAESKKALDLNATLLQKHGDVKVQIQGHADERGTSDYNLALGNRRAETVKKYLVNQGISPDRIAVISYGEEMPAARGGSESAWAQNRRAEFVVTWGVTATRP